MSSPKKTWANYDPITPTLLNDIGNFADDYFEITTGEAINGTTTPIPVCIKPTVGTVFKADGNDATLFNFIGFIVGNYGSAATALVKKAGIVGGFTGLTAGSYYYVQDSVGTIGSTPGTYECLVGIAVSTTQIFIMRNEFQYLGMATLTNNYSTATTVPTGTRRIIVKTFINGTSSYGGANTNSASGAQVVLEKNGAVDAASYFYIGKINGSSQSVPTSGILRATWSGANLIGLVGTSQGSTYTADPNMPAPDAYFYG